MRYRALVLGVLVASAGVTLGLLPGVNATQDTVSVRLVPNETTVDGGDTVDYDVVVSGLEGGGVGAIDIAILVDRPHVSIQNASVAGNPGLTDISISANKSRVRMRAAMMDTADSGEAVVGTVSVAGEATGTSLVELVVFDIGSEEGVSYPVSTGTAATLHVGESPMQATTTARTTQETTGSSAGDSTSGKSSTATGTTTKMTAVSTNRGRIDVRAVTVTPDQVTVGTETTFNVAVENVDSATRTVEAVVEIGDEIRATTIERLDGHSDRTISLTVVPNRVGDARIYVADQLVYSQRVVAGTSAAERSTPRQDLSTDRAAATSSSLSTSSPTTSTSVPGFSILMSIVAIGCGLVGLRLRTR